MATGKASLKGRVEGAKPSAAQVSRVAKDYCNDALELSLVIANGGTDRVSLDIEDVEALRVESVVELLAHAKLTPFDKAEKDRMTWAYFSAECWRNQNLLAAPQVEPNSSNFKEAMDRFVVAKPASSPKRVPHAP